MPVLHMIKRYMIMCVWVSVCVCVCVCVCETDADLSRRLDAPDETEEDDKPGDGQAAQDRHTDLSEVPDIIRDVQHIVSEKETEPEVRTGDFLRWVWFWHFIILKQKVKTVSAEETTLLPVGFWSEHLTWAWPKTPTGKGFFFIFFFKYYYL